MRKEIYRISAAMAVVFLVVSALWAGGKKTRFEVTSTVPTDRARGVTTDQTLTVTFNQDVLCSTVTASTFTLRSDRGGYRGVKGQIVCLGMQVTFTPEKDLAPNTTYTATIEERVKDVQGKRLECDFCWCFKTGSTALPPTVIAVYPLNGASGVALSTRITATFNEAMKPATLNTSTFLLHNDTIPGFVTVTSISYDVINNTATFVLPAILAANTQYTATITNLVTNLQGNAMVSDYPWTFTTGTTLGLTPPTVILTNPLNGASGVPLNQIITATFSEAMMPGTITTPPQFILQEHVGVTPALEPGTVSGVVSYGAGNTATFAPSANLDPNREYTATIETGVTDMAGNHLALPYVWEFTTGTGILSGAPFVYSTNPISGGTVCTNGAINATFDELMDPTTIPASFTVVDNGPSGSGSVSGTVSYAVTYSLAQLANVGIATFTPLTGLNSGDSYTATISSGAENLAEIPLTSGPVANPWTFSVSGTCTPAVPISLGSIAPVGTFGGYSGMTNEGLLTVIYGDIETTAASSTVTGFHDLTVTPYVPPSSGCTYTETPLNVGLVTGVIYTAAPPPNGTCPNEGTTVTAAVAAAALVDATTAWNNTAPALMPCSAFCAYTAELGNLVLAPGIYEALGGSFGITAGDLTLDAQGNANAVWVFQTGASGTLTVGIAGYPRTVHLINGAQASNVFWHVGSAATINYTGGGTMVGTIIAYSTVTLSSPANSTSSNLTYLTGRAISLTGSVTMVQTVITVP